jgi:hypothetical protein
MLRATRENDGALFTPTSAVDLALRTQELPTLCRRSSSRSASGVPSASDR